MFQKEKKNSNWISVLPYDCWSVITSYYSSSSDVFSLIRSCRDFWNMLKIENIRFFENVDFNVKNDENLINFYLKDETKIRFVRSFSIDLMMVKDGKGLFSDDKKSNDLIFRNILKKFPNFTNVRLTTKKHHYPDLLPKPSFSRGREFVLGQNVLGQNFFPKFFSITEICIVGDCFPIFGNNGPPYLFVFLQELRNLKILSLVDVVARPISREYLNFSDETSNLSHLKKIKEIYLSSIKGMDDFFSHGNDSVEIIKIDNWIRNVSSLFNKVNPEDYFPKLRELYVTEYSLFNNDVPLSRDRDRITVTPIENLFSNSLEKLVLKGSVDRPLTGVDFILEDCLTIYKNRFKNLKKLFLSNYVGNINICKDLSKLTSLEISFRRNSDFKLFSSILLEKYYLFSCFTNISMKKLKISLLGEVFLDEGFLFPNNRFLVCFPNLEELMLEECCLENVDSSGFVNFRKLKFLGIVNCVLSTHFNKEFLLRIVKKNPNLLKLKIYKGYCISTRLIENGEINPLESIKLVSVKTDYRKSMLKWFIEDKKKVMRGIIKHCKTCKKYVEPEYCENHDYFYCFKCEKVECDVCLAKCISGNRFCCTKSTPRCYSCGNRCCYDEIHAFDCDCEKVWCEACAENHTRETYCEIHGILGGILGDYEI